MTKSTLFNLIEQGFLLPHRIVVIMSVFETEDLGPIPSEATKLFYGVMAIISLSEREDPGSNPGRITYCGIG